MPKPFVIYPADRSRALSFVGEKITVLASREETQGYELFFQDGIKGTGPPPHSHAWDESFYVLRGNIRFAYGDREMVATPGTLVHVPGGVEHWFRFDSDGAQMLSVTGVGSRAAAFFTQLDANVSEGDDLAGLGVVAAKHGLTIGAPGESHE